MLSTMICIAECIALYLCFTFQLKWTVNLLHGDSFAPSPKNQIRRHCLPPSGVDSLHATPIGVTLKSTNIGWDTSPPPHPPVSAKPMPFDSPPSIKGALYRGQASYWCVTWSDSGIDFSINIADRIPPPPSSVNTGGEAPYL